MDAIILAGGLGTRLLPVVSDVPKPLAPVNGRPFLDLILDQLNKLATIENVVLAIGHKSDLIRAEYERRAEQFGFAILYSVEMTPLGTGGAIAKALELTSSDDVLVLNGDSFVDFDLRQLEACHVERGALVTLVAVRVDDTSRFGSIKLDESTNKLVEFAEKDGVSRAGLINGGCYLISRKLFDGLPTGASSFERDVLPRRLGAIYACETSGRFIDIGIPESYSLAADYLR